MFVSCAKGGGDLDGPSCLAASYPLGEDAFLRCDSGSNLNIIADTGCIVEPGC